MFLFLTAITVIYAEEINIDLGTITIADDAEIQEDMKAYIDQKVPTKTQKTMEQYIAELQRICIDIIKNTLKSEFDNVRADQVEYEASIVRQEIKDREVIVKK